MNSPCLSLLRFVWPAWPVQSTYITALDKLQSNCVQRLFNLKQRPHESVADLVRRRSCHAGRVISLTGRWSHEWCRDAISWHQHCLRSSDRRLPLLEILGHKTVSPDFLSEQRARFQLEASKPSTTGTRLPIGKVQVRHHDGIEFARKHLSDTDPCKLRTFQPEDWIKAYKVPKP